MIKGRSPGLQSGLARAVTPSLAASALGLLLAAGCAQVAEDSGSTRAPSARSEPRAPDHASVRQEPVAPETRKNISIDRLIGAREATLRQLLGKPDFRRVDPPARLVRYRAPACLLDLFLYPEADGAHRVTHIEARSLNGEDRPLPPCLDAVTAEIENRKTG